TPEQVKHQRYPPASDDARRYLRRCSEAGYHVPRPHNLVAHPKIPSFVVEASIGITVYPQHGEEVTTLLRRAGLARYRAKRTGGGYSLDTPSEDQHGPRRVALVADLRGTIAHDQLLLHFPSSRR